MAYDEKTRVVPNPVEPELSELNASGPARRSTHDDDRSPETKPWIVRAGNSISRQVKLAADTVYLAFNGSATVLAATGVFASLGVSGIAVLGSRIASGDYQAMTLGLATCTALMGGSLSFAFFSLKGKVNDGLAKSAEALSDIEKHMAHDKIVKQTIARLLNDVRNTVQYDHDTHSALPVLDKGTTICTPNSSKTWSGFAPGTRLSNAGAVAQADISEYRDGDGQPRYTADANRLVEWLPRHIGRTKLARIDQIFILTDQQLSGDLTLSSALKRVMAAYKALRQIAENSGIDHHLDLSNVRVHLMSSDHQISNAIFVGWKQIKTGAEAPETVPMVIRYDALGQVISPAMTMLDPKVYVSFDEEDALSSQRMIDSWLPHAVRTFCMDELLNRYGHEIPLDPCSFVADEGLLLSLNLPHPTSVQEHASSDFDIIDLGDGSFSFVQKKPNPA